jgi:hypothetical protein
LRRQTNIPTEDPSALTDEFAHDEQKVIQWEAFLGRNGLDAGGVTLSSVVRALRERLVPLLSIARVDT